MSLEQLLIDFGIYYQTEGHKHCSPGWANMECPFCSGNPGLHLGAHISSGRFYCWRCGWKPTSKALAKILSIDEGQAKTLVRKYKLIHRSSVGAGQDSKIQFHPHKLPSPHGKLEKRHKKYLEKRGFDPEYLEQEWSLLGTGPISFLDKINYKNRIIAPIFWEGVQVSFQTRDITGKSNIKYMACPKDRETIHHKHILYGNQKKWKDVGIVVEGITDVWRLGGPAFATFGIEFTRRQIRQIAKAFKRVVILFDDDPQAIKQAKDLQPELEVRGLDTRIKTIKGDPADMPQDDADHLVNEMTRIVYYKT